MRLLFDTHVLLCVLLDPARLDGETRGLLQHRATQVAFSAASIWEIAIKAGLGRADFRIDPDRVAEAARQIGFVELPVRAGIAARVKDLPPHHRDPFDHLLIAQALAEPMRLYTADRRLQSYSELVVLVG